MVLKTILILSLMAGALAQMEQVPAEIKQQYSDMLKEYCKTNGGDDSFAKAEKSIGTFVNCVKELMDVNVIKKEIEDAKPTGSLDEVFGKYCAKSPQLKSCIHQFTTGISPCMAPNVREHIPAAENATEQLIEFVCQDSGNRIALFIADHGPECFMAKTNEVRACANKLKDSVPTIEALKALTLNEQCGKYDELSACTVKALEECDDPTAANMLEALFKFIRKGSPCKSVTKN